MGFLKGFQKLTKAAIDIVVTPVEVVKDAFTLGGSLTDKDETYTGKRLRSAIENINDAYESIDED